MSSHPTVHLPLGSPLVSIWLAPSEWPGGNSALSLSPTAACVWAQQVSSSQGADTELPTYPSLSSDEQKKEKGR